MPAKRPRLSFSRIVSKDSTFTSKPFSTSTALAALGVSAMKRKCPPSILSEIDTALMWILDSESNSLMQAICPGSFSMVTDSCFSISCFIEIGKN